jgi:hypothetical protein
VCQNGIYKLETIYIIISRGDLIFILNFITLYTIKTILIIYTNFIYVRFGVITAISKKINVFWDLMICRVAERGTNILADHSGRSV